MTLSTTTSRITYAGDGSTVAFAVPFSFFGVDEIDVIERNAATGVETSKILATHYTVIGGGGDTGTVTAIAAPDASKSWTITRRTKRTQMIDYTPNDPFPAETHERALDRLTALVQELDDKVGRTAALSPTSPVTNLTLPYPSAETLLGWKSDLSGLENKSVPTGTTINAGIITTRAGTSTTESVTPRGVSALWRKGSDIASAASLAKPEESALGGYHLVTGTASIAGLWSEVAGMEIELCFAAAATLIHHAVSFILPGGGNIIAAAGDVARFRSEGSSNWRCVSAPPRWFTTVAPGVGISIPVVTKTVNYTMLTADKGSEIAFSTGGVTLSLLAAATAGNGTVLIVRNAAASGDVTIDPSGSESLDGLTTRAVRPGDRVMIRCDGSGWATILGEYSYTTSEIALVAAAGLTDAHGLGGTPDRIRTILRCKTAELGYAVGDEIEAAYTFYNAYEHNNVQVFSNTTNLRAIQGMSKWWIAHATSGVVTVITAANWKLVVKAWRK